MQTPKTHKGNADTPGTAPHSSRVDRLVDPGAADTVCLLAQEMRKNDQFVDLLNAFRLSGGLARVAEVAARFQMYGVDAVSPLAGWIETRQVISFEWQSRLWLPLFQFNPVGLTLRSGLGAVLTELPKSYDDWAVATWFARPNPLLAHRTPADMLAVAAAQVCDAARAERFKVVE